MKSLESTEGCTWTWDMSNDVILRKIKTRKTLLESERNKKPEIYGIYKKESGALERWLLQDKQKASDAERLT